MSSADLPHVDPAHLRPTAADKAALHELFAALSGPGATPEGGLHRLSASAEDGAARRLFRDWLAARGAKVRVDEVGNIFGLMEWREGAPVILCGSHLDSQPTGGRYDGTFGVACAALAQQIVARALRASGISPRFNLAVVDWTNEEGARFVPSLLGSSVFTGALAADAGLAAVDDAGVNLGEALDAIGFRGTERLGLPLAGYAEIHVEQGLGLEVAGAQIGVVRSTWAALKLRVRFDGEQAHTGPTPMSLRRDALLAAARMIVEVRALADGASDGVVHSSVARLGIYPNSANVVPSAVTAYVEFRAEAPDVLARIETEFGLRLRQIAGRTHTRVTVEDRSLRVPAPLDDALGDLAHRVCRDGGLVALDARSVSGHDAIALSRVTPTVLLFVPSAGGIAHNVHEFTEAADLEAGLEALAGVIGRMCMTGEGLTAAEDRGAAA